MDCNSPCRSFGVLVFSDEIQLGGADVVVAGQLAGFVKLGSVLDRIVEGSFAKTVDSDAAAAEPFRWNSGLVTVFFDDSPDSLAAECLRQKKFAVW